MPPPRRSQVPIAWAPPGEPVALIPKCAECDAVWLPADEERWQAWLTYDEPPEVAFYCPECAEREFAD